MRQINVWAYHTDFGNLCRNAKLDDKSGVSYPNGTTKGQAGWDVAVPFKSLSELAAKLSSGLSMPPEFCGHWLSDCSPIQRGEVIRLTIMAHGDHGQFAVDGKSNAPMTAGNINTYHKDLHTIGLYTPEAGATILLTGCLAGNGSGGDKLLIGLSKVWPGRTTVGFSTVGYRHPGQMKRPGEPCEYPGMRDTDATAYIYSNPYKWDRQWQDFDALEWASPTSRHAKVALNGTIIRYPQGEAPPLQVKPGSPARPSLRK